MTTNSHGGGCCGYKHIFNLDRMPLGTFEAEVASFFEGDAVRNNNRVVEVILSERQVAPANDDTRVHQSIREAGGWPVVLAAKGFKLSQVWRNSNSGHLCFQFLKTTEFYDGPLPFAWDGTRMAFRPAPIVETLPVVVGPVVFEVGETVRARRDGILRVVTEITENGSIRAQRLTSPRTTATFAPTEVERVTIVPEDAGLAPARVDPALPLFIRNLRTGEIHRFTIQGEANETSFQGRSVSRSVSIDARNLQNVFSYERDTGNWTSCDRTARVFNLPATPVVTLPTAAPVPAPVAPPPGVTVLTEYFAVLRVGTRGPFATTEAVREAFPRCRRVMTRTIISDGRVTTTEEVLP